MTLAKTNGTHRTTIQWKYVAATGIFVGGIIAGLVINLSPVRTKAEDIWTITNQGQYATLIDERLANVTRQISELTQLVQQHTLLEMHGGSRVQFTQMRSDLDHIQESLKRIEKRLEKIETRKDGG
jgi:hypothetical protein